MHHSARDCPSYIGIDGIGLGLISAPVRLGAPMKPRVPLSTPVQVSAFATLLPLRYRGFAILVRS